MPACRQRGQEGGCRESRKGSGVPLQVIRQMGLNSAHRCECVLYISVQCSRKRKGKTYAAEQKLSLSPNSDMCFCDALLSGLSLQIPMHSGVRGKAPEQVYCRHGGSSGQNALL